MLYGTCPRRFRIFICLFMNFRTEIKIERAKQDICHRNKIVSFGSCFSENIGERLASLKFDILVNPFGILYNPESIRVSAERLMDGSPLSEKEIFENQGLWHSFLHHSRFSKTSPGEFLANANDALTSASAFLKCSDLLLITFGTAWVYRLKESGSIVSNCHKLPGNLFFRERLSVDEIVKNYNSLLASLNRINPSLRVIFTVSPIRHWKDGANGNQLSKATLLLAIEEICKRNSNCEYFPAFEILMDELRDYRFYADDMLHPSSAAVEYIWERFSDCYFSDETKGLIREIAKISASANHRPFNSDNERHAIFKKNLLAQIEKLSAKHPNLDFAKEIDRLS